MKKLSLLSIGLAFAACSGQGTSSQSGRLTAGADARHAGVYAYAVEGDTVTMFDRDGIEFGRVAVSAPTDDRRVFIEELADGTLDDAEVDEPLSTGRFFAPITPQTPLTAAMADPALAPTWERYQVRFRLNVRPLLAGDRALAPSVRATLTACSSPSSDSPLGCARPANTAVGCSNPSQLPATRYDNTNADILDQLPGYSTQAMCLGNAPTDCANYFGGNVSDWYPVGGGTGAVTCTQAAGPWLPVCHVGTSGNSWIASCPRSTCGTVGQYDAVPRLRDCNSPGSCTKSQGTVGCTPYH